MTQTTTLTDWLLEQIAEDETVARGCDVRPLRIRTLATCAAHRAIVEADICHACEVEMQECDHRDTALRAIASIYAGSPGYAELALP